MKERYYHDISMHQEYYLVQYFNYKDNICQNIVQVKQFNYFGFKYDETLLHGANIEYMNLGCNKRTLQHGSTYANSHSRSNHSNH